MGYHASNDQEIMAEYVPAAETVDDWSRMVTVQVFHKLKNVDPDAFADSLANGWKSACASGAAQKVTAGVENGYPVSLWKFVCPLNPGTGKPENMWLKATSGADSLYSVQYAYRSSTTEELAATAAAYLKTVSVCDARRPDRPCPKGM